MRALPGCALALAGWLAAAVGAQGKSEREGRAFVELELAPETAVVGQAVDVTVRIGLEPELARRQLIQLLRRQLDLAVRIDTPWAHPIEGCERLGTPPGFEAGPSAVVDGALGAVRRTGEQRRGARTFATYELVERLVPTRPGRLAIPGAVLRFAWSSAFDEDFLGDRVPRDRQDVHLVAAGVGLVVEEAPRQARPPSYAGLVGRVRVHAALDGLPDARVGEGVALRLVVESDGDLRPFRAPELSGLASFHVRGVRQEEEPGRRVVVYDLLPLRAGACEIPAVAVPYLDPGPPPRYRSAVSGAIALQVGAAADGTEAVDREGRPVAGEAVPPPVAAGNARPERVEPVPGVDVLFGLLPVARRESAPPPDFAAPRPLSGGVLAMAWLVPWLAVLLLAWVRRHAGGRARRARRRRRRRARSVFRREVGEPGRDRGAALVGYLAAWLDCAPAAVVDPSLPVRLQAAGLAAELAAEVDGALDRLAGARFGGPPGRPADADLLDLVGRLDQQLRAREAERRRAARTAAGWLLGALPLLVPLAPAPVPSGDPEAAARAFRAGDPARAFELYRQALDAGGWDAAALCYDLGNCSHALGRSAESVLWYRRALRLDPGHFETRANLRLVERQLGLVDPVGRALARTWLRGVAGRLGEWPPGGLLLGAVVLQLVGLVGLLLRRRGGLAVAGLTVGLAIGGAVSWQQLEPHGAVAVVLRDGARMRVEPHESVGVALNLRAGEAIEVLEQSARWARVRCQGEIGWLATAAFERVATP